MVSQWLEQRRVCVSLASLPAADPPKRKPSGPLGSCVFLFRFNNPDQKIYCGIDVSKKHLDAFIHNKTVRFANTVKGLAQLMKQAGEVHYVFESAGVYERLAAWHLLEEW